MNVCAGTASRVQSPGSGRSSPSLKESKTSSNSRISLKQPESCGKTSPNDKIPPKVSTAIDKSKDSEVVHTSNQQMPAEKAVDIVGVSGYSQSPSVMIPTTVSTKFSDISSGDLIATKCSVSDAVSTHVNNDQKLKLSSGSVAVESNSQGTKKIYYPIKSNSSITTNGT